MTVCDQPIFMALHFSAFKVVARPVLDSVDSTLDVTQLPMRYDLGYSPHHTTDVRA